MAPLEQTEQVSQAAVGRPLSQQAVELALSLRSQVRVPDPKEEIPLARSISALLGVLRGAEAALRGPVGRQVGLHSAAAEWFTDNYYSIESAAAEVERDLPGPYHHELPVLSNGLPRVHALVQAFLVAESFLVDLPRLFEFLDAYQQQDALKLGEVWAVPIMLRLALLQHIAVAAARVSGLSASDPESERRQHWLGLGLVEPGLTDEEIVSHSVPALKAIDAQDWEQGGERISAVHQILAAGDPSGVYARMEFDSRDRYRRAVERIAGACGGNELRVAEQAVALANREDHPRSGDHGRFPPGDDGALRLDLPVSAHVGYYLLDEGSAELEAQLGVRISRPERLRRYVFRHPTGFYLGAILGLGLGLALAAGVVAVRLGGDYAVAISAFAVGAVPALGIAVSGVNWFLHKVLPVRVLPKLDFESGIAGGCGALVVVPTLISSPAQVDEALAMVRDHALRNPDPALTFAVLADFPDADAETLPGDADLWAHARRELAALNAETVGSPFLYLHRRRVWSPGEGVWLGWERKRGKLHELNRLLRGAKDTTYEVVAGNTGRLAGSRFVITLDADTLLPSGAAARLIGTLSHPLNRARIEPSTGRVVAGYTVLQPRAHIEPDSAGRSLFSEVFAGDRTVDLYSRAASDVYQDLFGAGIFVGKGIYEVDSFERTLAGSVPENRLLSHDLFEGSQGRAGLVSDIVVFEDYPPNYLAALLRSHRWMRGDWQLLPWLGSRVPAATGRTPNPLSTIDRWKIADNLRRALAAPATVLLLAAGWLWLPGPSWFWTLFALAVPIAATMGAAARALATAVVEGIQRRPEQTWQTRLGDLGTRLIRWLLYVAFLGVESVLAVDAMARSLWRMYVSRRHLLEWTTAARVARTHAEGVPLAEAIRRTLPGSALALGLALLTQLVRPDDLPDATALLVVWLAAPFFAYLVSLPRRTPPRELDPAAIRQLRVLARRTWLFYETFVGPEDNWLPPDNYQEHPLGVAAHRTSPTNVGLYLLSSLAAHDRGYLGAEALEARLRFAFATLDRLQRHRGHFLNWIDTRTLEPLAPAYVSTVDSGNLAGCLIALRQGLLDIPQRPVWEPSLWQGLEDAVWLMLDALPDHPTQPALLRLRDFLTDLADKVASAAGNRGGWGVGLLEIQARVRASLSELLAEALESSGWSPDTEVLETLHLYATRLQHQVDGLLRELRLVLPVELALPEAPAALRDPGPQVRVALRALAAAIPADVTWHELPAHIGLARECVTEVRHSLVTEPAKGRVAALAWLSALDEALAGAAAETASTLSGLGQLSRQCDEFVAEMSFKFLYDPSRGVFHVGYNVDAARLDNSYYDLLASEARLASLLAIARGEVPQRHWLRLGRPMSRTLTGERVLLSWSGTMFEYLMPPLLVPTHPESLLGRSCGAAVRQQIAYARSNGLPWGVSESGFFAFDSSLSYQYQAFGVPGLGLRRGLAEDRVVAPYASVLGLPWEPEAVVANLARLRAVGGEGRYGLYEAVDFTASRLGLGQDHAVVRSHMAHHQGMILLALAARLDGPLMQDRFAQEPSLARVALLLREGLPDAAATRRVERESEESAQPVPVLRTEPWTVQPDAPQPRVHHLSNGRYSVLLTGAGGGYSAWEDVAITRWRADSTLDDWGTWVYVRDLESSELWSVGRQPTGRAGGREVVTFHPGWAEFQRHVDGLGVRMEITVAPSDDVEIRVVTLTNDSDRTRRLDVSAYSELALAPQADDLRHPGFGKLFVEAEEAVEVSGLLFRRRPRAEGEPERFVVGCVVRGPHEAGEGSIGPWGRLERATDRPAFLGRGRTARSPVSLDEVRAWGQSDIHAAPLDPALALGQEVTLQPHETRRLAFLTTVGTDRGAALELARRYQSWSVMDHAFTAGRAAAERELAVCGFSGEALSRVQTLLGLLTYPSGALRAAPADFQADRPKGRAWLWGLGISGDLPIVLVELRADEELELLAEVLQAHTYWRRRGLAVDLVVLDSQSSGYDQGPRSAMLRQVRRAGAERLLNAKGGVFVINAGQLQASERAALVAHSTVVMDGAEGTLVQQVDRLAQGPTRLPALPLVRDDALAAALAPSVGGDVERPTDLEFDNGLGGFDRDGKEYVIHLSGALPPAPWANVVANPEFGFLASETGLGPTWSVNSGENRLTPWRNDPVSDPPAEAVYIRDEETGHFFTPTPLPAGGPNAFEVRHGAGYTRWRQRSHALETESTAYIAHDSPVKFVKLRLRNLANRPRRLTLTYFAEWVLGVHRDETQAHIEAWYDDAVPALFARNRVEPDSADRLAFLTSDRPVHGWTCDRTEFLGRLGSRANPAALHRIGLASAAIPGQASAAALQVHLDLAPDGEEEVCFLLGQGGDAAEAVELAAKWRAEGAAMAAWEASLHFWETTLGAVRVRTPDRALDLILNRWLPYQALSCRIWGRSAHYQSSGAYGFRDQLQDVLALVWARPDLAREHLLRAAAHQFVEGDVLHWWHPPTGRGVRTRISDDLLWLPWVTARYVEQTGDESVLREMAPFRTGPQLTEGQDDRYDTYPVGAEADLLDHCRRALGRLRTGDDGLPLMGSGDWNDGMNRVGVKGRGQSVWLGWFAHSALLGFAALCERVGLSEEGASSRRRAQELCQAIEAAAWDGAWYRRATFDDGTPLGSRENPECRIDSIAQSWAVLSGAPRGERTAQALAAVAAELADPELRLLRLFTPAFDSGGRDPGYIKGYVPGVRENGGQYTHGATWAVWAAAELGQADRATEWFSYLNPITHTATPEQVAKYQVEPYVSAADVYSAVGHEGRGGWTWYTGSAAWLYRTGIEQILGLRLHEGKLEASPRLPEGWAGYEARVRIAGREQTVRVTRGAGGPICSVADAGENPAPVSASIPALKRVLRRGKRKPRRRQ